MENFGNVVPFAVHQGRLRRRAADYRKARRPVEALELLRQAMEREDCPAVRMEIAETLMETANYEQAAEVLYRLLSRADAPEDVWMLLARAQTALGQTVAACDCLYHYLMLDPYSDTADYARDLLGELEQDADAHEPFRLAALGSRALRAWKRGDRDLAYRRMDRAVKIALHPERQRLTIALLAMAEGDYLAACKQLLRALRRQPDQPRALSALCVALHTMGKKRMALAVLQRCAKACAAPESEGMFLTTAWTLGARDTLRRYLEERLRQTPCRVALLHPMAVLCSKSVPQQAARLWQRVLRIDPGDQRARVCLRYMEERPDQQVPPDGSLPIREIQSMLYSLLSASGDADALDCGKQARMLADWFFTVPDARIQEMTFRMVTRVPRDGLEAYLRELLTAPGVLPDIREKALLKLHEMGVAEPMPLLAGMRMSMAQCTGDPSGKARFRAFLPLLLQETRRYGQSMPMAFYAAGLWERMSPRQRAQATGERGYAFIKAMELRYLIETHQEESALRVLDRLQISRRRVQRVLRELERLDLPLKGE